MPSIQAPPLERSVKALQDKFASDWGTIFVRAIVPGEWKGTEVYVELKMTGELVPDDVNRIVVRGPPQWIFTGETWLVRAPGSIQGLWILSEPWNKLLKPADGEDDLEG